MLLTWTDFSILILYRHLLTRSEFWSKSSFRWSHEESLCFMSFNHTRRFPRLLSVKKKRMISHIYSNESRLQNITLLFLQLFAIHVPAFRAKITALVLPMAILMFALVSRASLELTASVCSIYALFCMLYFSTWQSEYSAYTRLKTKMKRKGSWKGKI